MRGMELSLAMIRSVTVTLQRLPPTLCWDTGKPSHAHAGLPTSRAQPSLLSLLASHPLLTHPATLTPLSACCVPSTTAEPEDPAGNKASRTKLTVILKGRWIMIR